ncbi:MAG TPA: hypothetical protein VGL00_07650 [Terracidiphilus sp.]
MKICGLSLLALLVSAAPALASITISSPSKGTRVVSPFGLNASATPCWSQAIVGMSYWLDNSEHRTTVYSGATLAVQVSAALGSHTVHVSALTRFGWCATSSVSISVVPSPLASVPSTAVVVKAIQALPGWLAADDGGTGSGTATGSMQLVASPSMSGKALSFVTDYTNSAGERYSVVFDADTTVSNFLYDAWIQLAGPSADIANLEFDMNQVTADGETVIFGVQCDGYSSTWDYTTNAGTPENFSDQWLHATAPCNPRAWTLNTWHHVQMTYARDSEGNVTYKSIWLDGVQQDLNATVPSSFALGWGSVLLTNFQVDGLGGYGAVMAYMDNLTVYRW